MDPPTTRQPVFLVHGLAGADHSWWALRSALAAAGFETVIALRHRAFRVDIPGVADWLVDHAVRAMTMTGSTGVHLIGHSMGGLVVRTAVQTGGLADQVTTAVTIATPHRGTGFAHLLPGPAARQLRPDSEFLAWLGDQPVDQHARWVNIHAVDDRVVATSSAGWSHPQVGPAARPPHIEQVLQDGVGHRSILRHPRIVGQVISALAAGEAAASFRSTAGRSEVTASQELSMAG
ncbi:MAG: alpha/beta fold hydrolase [Nakamurella sp.]